MIQVRPKSVENSLTANQGIRTGIELNLCRQDHINACPGSGVQKSGVDELSDKFRVGGKGQKHSILQDQSCNYLTRILF